MHICRFFISLILIFKFRGYTDPALVCEDDDGTIYCPGKIPGSETAFVQQWCLKGVIYYINKVTGNKYKKGRLSGSKKPKKQEKEVDDSSSTESTSTTTPTTTTTSTTTTRSTSTTTTRRNLRRSTTTQPTTLAASPSDEIESNFNDITFEDEISGNVIEDGSIVGISEVDVESLSEKPGEFTVEYVNTVLEDSVPNVKVNICAILHILLLQSMI